MQKLFLLLILIAIILPSCGIDKAEKVADEYHEKLDNHEYEYIVKNLCDDELIEVEGEDGMLGFFYMIETWGPIKDRTKDIGFSKQVHDGMTTVKLNYTFKNDRGDMYEGLILADRGNGYKLLTILMNQDKDFIATQLDNY